MRSWIKNALIFLSGASFFHFVSHLILPYYMELPLATKFGTLTMTVNVMTTIFSGIVTALLIWGAYRMSRQESRE